MGSKQNVRSSSSSKNQSTTLRFEDGAVQFRQRLAVSLLSNRPVLIKNIRADSIDHVGLQPHEATFLRLLDEMTNGSRIEINNTGTQLRFVPGVLLGGEIELDCPVASAEAAAAAAASDEDASSASRSVSWYLEGILPLAPFGKDPLHLKLTGITDGTCETDPSCDYWKSTALPLMARFGIGVTTPHDKDFLSPQSPSLRVLRRGAAPLGGGLMEFYCPNIRSELQPIDWTDMGKFKRVRGNCVSTKLVSSSQAARVAYAAKGVLHRLLPDVWIHTDCHTVKQHRCGPSPSLSLVLTAESTTGVVMSAECGWNVPTTNGSSSSNTNRELPEDLGTRGAVGLLEEIRRGGCIDTGIQSLALLWMCLTPEDVSRIRVGTLSSYTIESLRLFKQALGVEFKVKTENESKTVLLSCFGTGYRNMARAST